MKPIGGYFELELEFGNSHYHETITFKSGRSALLHILTVVKPTNVYIPFYTCNALLEPFKKAGITYSFYEIDQNLEPRILPQLQPNEYFLYINYFGLKSKTVDKLSAFYADRLIVDCSQSFYVKGNGNSWYFNSCRKFFGVPDGSFLYVPSNQTASEPAESNKNYIVDHLAKRLEGEISEGYIGYQKNEALCEAELKKMSQLSNRLLSHINYDLCAAKRKKNFSYIHEAFKSENTFLIEEDQDAVPMGYPLLFEKPISHKLLWEKSVFVPIYWNDVISRESNGYYWERRLSDELLLLPIDHRYNIEEMDQMIKLIKKQC